MNLGRAFLSDGMALSVLLSALGPRKVRSAPPTHVHTFPPQPSLSCSTVRAARPTSSQPCLLPGSELRNMVPENDAPHVVATKTRDNVEWEDRPVQPGDPEFKEAEKSE